MNKTINLKPGPNTIRVPSLNIGFFFDGTKNNINDEDQSTNTNVAKLFKIYRSQKEDPNQFAAHYVRGVGSKAITEEDKKVENGNLITDSIGAGTGTGAYARTNYMYNLFQDTLNAYKDRNKRWPGKVFIDVFGFSRGAALARHFVNIINKNEFAVGRQTVNLYPPETKAEVRFLGIFDTVGSFGMPGDDKDGNFNFHVDNTKARYIYHITAEDELRANFDLQSIATGPGQNLSAEKADKARINGAKRWMIEEEFPGVHADIGGGYTSIKEDHYIQDNNLAKMYLRKMHERCLQCGVPLKTLIEIEQDKNFYNNHWKTVYTQSPPPPKLEDLFKEINKTYLDRNSTRLRTKHKILREHQRAVEIYQRKAKNPPRPSDGRITPPPINIPLEKAERETKYRIIPMQEAIIRECFNGNKSKFKEFENDYNKLRNYFIHISHAPFDSMMIGMDAQQKRLDNTRWPLVDSPGFDVKNFIEKCEPWKLQREVFYPKAK